MAWKNALLYTELSNQLEARQRTEKHLRQLQTAIDFAGDDILITDEKGTILYYNPAFERQRDDVYLFIVKNSLNRYICPSFYPALGLKLRINQRGCF